MKILLYNNIYKIWALRSCKFKSILKINFSFLKLGYVDTYYWGLYKFIFLIKRIYTFLNSFKKKDISCLFVATETLYGTFIKKKLKKVLPINSYLDFFFLKYSSACRYFEFYKIISKNIDIIFAINTDYFKNLVKVSLSKKVLIVGLINGDTPSNYIDYPILSNTKYFFSYYFMSKLFFKFLCLSNFNSNLENYVAKNNYKELNKNVKC